MTESAGYKFSLKSIGTKVLFYTAFPSYQHLKICFGPATEQLMYRDSRRVFDHSNNGRVLSRFCSSTSWFARAGHCLSLCKAVRSGAAGAA